MVLCRPRMTSWTGVTRLSVLGGCLAMFRLKLDPERRRQTAADIRTSGGKRQVAIPTPISAPFAILLAIAACMTAPHGNADPTTQQSPFPTGKSGSTIHVTEYSGATADVTLNNATWISSGCSGGGGCNVIELTVVG